MIFKAAINDQVRKRSNWRALALFAQREHDGKVGHGLVCIVSIPCSALASNQRSRMEQQRISCLYLDHLGAIVIADLPGSNVTRQGSTNRLPDSECPSGSSRKSAEGGDATHA